jgi:hypothetical protein
MFDRLPFNPFDELWANGKNGISPMNRGKKLWGNLRGERTEELYRRDVSLF